MMVLTQYLSYIENWYLSGHCTHGDQHREVINILTCKKLLNIIIRDCQILGMLKYW